MAKSNGPSAEPWGTPKSSVLDAELGHVFGRESRESVSDVGS